MSDTIRNVLAPAAVSWVAVLVAGLAACPVRRQGPELPTINDQTREIARRIDRTRTIRKVMTRDLDRARELADQLQTPPNGLFGPGFPLDLFKHVAVECLNAPTTDESGARPTGRDAGPSSAADAGTDAGDPTLACATRFAPNLYPELRRLDSKRRQQALKLLERVDEFHTIRVRLRRRLRQIESIVESNRQLASDGRADLRRLRSRWERRKTQLRDDRWRALQRRFDRLGKQLETLESETDRLEDETSGWPERIDDANYRVYFGITSKWKRSK